MKKKHKLHSFLAPTTVISCKIKKRKKSHTNDEDEESFFSKQFAVQENVKQKVSALIEKSDFILGINLEIQKCPFCKQYTATYRMLQTRSIDEGSSALFTCKSSFCAKSWKGKC
jgi:DNA-directed RNA polymerase subunit M/transcription elongation factor TFIIS